MKKALILVVFIAFLFGGSFVERIDAAPVCGACETDANCDGDLVCQGAVEGAQGLCQEKDTIQICNPLQTENFTGIVNNILDILFNFALLLTPLMIVVAGIMFVTAGGSPERISTAKRILLWTAVGFVIILLAKGLIVVLRAIIGF
ncbi:hypothetical protein IH982_02395 [Patescibacteria group bacterium]|nr:hypothetical protein [Patescibacteria group bacterium]